MLSTQQFKRCILKQHIFLLQDDIKLPTFILFDNTQTEEKIEFEEFNFLKLKKVHIKQLLRSFRKN